MDACKSLTRLDASANNLTSVDGIAAASTLRWLSVAKNQVTSLEPLRDLEHLEVLNAAHNQMQGKISMGKFRFLKALILNDNAGIKTVGGLEKLKHLDALVLSHNAIESLGGWLNGATALQKLSLSYNPIQDVTGAFSGCPNLQELRLNHCQLTELPDSLASNARLLTLEVGSNKIADFESLEVLKQLPLLRQLTLKGCPVSELPGYQERIVKLVPRLQILDNKRLDGGKKRKDRSETGGDLKKWAPAKAASNANAIPIAPSQRERENVLEIERKKEETVEEEEDITRHVKKKEKKEKPHVSKKAPPPAEAKKVIKTKTAPAAQKMLDDDDDDDDALDPSTFVSTSFAKKSNKNTPGNKQKLDAKQTGVVKISKAAAGATAVDKKKEKSLKKATEKSSASGPRGAHALQALLTAHKAVEAPGTEDALAGWD